MKLSLKLLLVITAMSLSYSCQEKGWKTVDSIILQDISPIGLVFIGDEIVLSDGDGNRIVRIDDDGVVKDAHTLDVERPMHMDMSNGDLYVPSYGIDQILVLSESKLDTLDVPYQLDAPASVSVSDTYVAIADFYNDRILLKTDDQWRVLGEKGKGKGQFSYPTDVQIFEGKVYVADAYNHRVQVWDISGKHLFTFGTSEKMNATTGLFVDEDGVWVTDFERDRILLYTLEGKLVQIIDDGLDKPTDLYKKGSKLYVTNYNGQYVSVYEK